MNIDLIVNSICVVIAIAYVVFMICLAKKDGILEAILFFTLPARCFNYMVGGRFWGELDQEAVYGKVENKLVGAPVDSQGDYPKELKYTLWWHLFTPEGKRETKLGWVRPLWVVIPMLLFMASACLITAFIEKFW